MDIIFFAALALFIALKLKEQLGKISDIEKDNITKKVKNRQERILKLQNKITEQIYNTKPENAFEQSLKNNPALKNIDSKTKKSLQEILQKGNLSFEFFIEGSKSAFEMTLKAFSENDKETLKFLLVDKIYNGFANSIDERKKENKNLRTNLIGIEKTEIVSASFKDNIAFITVKFVSNQINYFINEKDEIIEGDKSHISRLTDVWTFKKDLSNNINPNWKISATS